MKLLNNKSKKDKNLRMNIVLISLLSTGFVGGVFSGLKRSTKSLFIFLFSALVFFLIVPMLAKISNSISLFQNEFVEMLGEGFLNRFDILDVMFESKDDFLVFVENNSSGVLKDFLMNLSFAYNPGEKIYTTVSKSIYKILVFFLLSIMVFLLLNMFIRFVFSFFFHFKNSTDGLFFTKRLFGGFLGLIKGFVLFVSVINILNIVIEILGISSNIFPNLSLGKGYYKNISAIFHGYV